MNATAVGMATLGFSYLVSQFYRAFLAVLYPALTRDLGVDVGDLSLAQSVWFAAFAFAQFPIGTALDRVGPRLTTALLLGLGGGGGMLLFAVASAPWMIMVAMALIGLGCAPVLMASLYVYARMLPPERFATATALVVGFGTFGNVAAAAPLAYLVEAIGWRQASLLLAAVTAMVAGAIWALCQDPPKLQDPPREGFGRLLRIRALWLILPLVLVSYATPAGLRGFWAGPYFNEIFGMDTVAIGEATFWMALGMAVGPILYGPLDRLFRSKKVVTIAGSLLTGGFCAALAVYSGQDATLSIWLFGGVGLFGVVYPVVIAHGRGFFPPHLIGRGVTLLNFFSIGGVGVMQFVSGEILTRSGGEPAQAFSALFWSYVAALALALVVYLFSREARPEESLEREPSSLSAEAPAIRRS